jgi:ribonuclease R
VSQGFRVISGVTEMGYLRWDYWNKCEGMGIRDIRRLLYVRWNNMHWLEQLNQLLQLGDEIFVKVKNADLVKKKVDFNFVRRIEPLK